MTRAMLSAIMLSCACLYAEPIDDATFAQVMAIADREGVPRSVAARLMLEESGDPWTGSRGNPKAVGNEPSGYPSKGLYQLHTKPSNINELLRIDWYGRGESDPFDIWDPRHNATVALRYVARKHRDLGTWYRAIAFYNCGSSKSDQIPERTKRYALRIISAGEP